MKDALEVAEGLAKHRDNFNAVHRILLNVRMNGLPLGSVRFGRWQVLNAKMLVVDNYRPMRSGERSTDTARDFRRGLGLLAKAASVFRLKGDDLRELDALLWYVSFYAHARAEQRFRTFKLALGSNNPRLFARAMAAILLPKWSRKRTIRIFTN